MCEIAELRIGALIARRGTMQHPHCRRIRNYVAVAALALGPACTDEIDDRTDEDAVASACTGASAAPGSNLQSVINAAGDNATICIRPGVHRVTAPLAPRPGQTLQGDAGAILNGSIVLTSWTASGATWFATADLPEYSDPGQCDDNVLNLCRRREQVFRNGVHLQRVGRLADVGSGKFYQDYAANRTYLGDNPAGQLVEMSRTAYAIQSGAARVTVRGLTIEKFASPSQKGAIFVNNGADWVIADNRIQWNHAAGIHTADATRAHVSGNVIVRNGQLGISQFRSHDVVIEDNEIAFNNTDGYYIADWESGGYKVTFSERGIAQFNRVHDNLGIGMWADIDNADLTFRNNVITNNAACGIRYEISRTGTIHDNEITGNGFGRQRNGSDYSLFASAGININGSEGMDIHHNTVANNVNGIGLQMRCRNRAETACTRPDWFLRNNRVHDNTVTMRTGARAGENASGLGVLGTFDNSQSYYTGQNNRFFNNTYRLDSLSRARFLFRNASGNRAYMTGAAFQAAGQEPGGRFLLAP